MGQKQGAFSASRLPKRSRLPADGASKLCACSTGGSENREPFPPKKLNVTTELTGERVTTPTSIFIGRRLGSGGFASVFLGTMAYTQKEVAVKIITVNAGDDLNETGVQNTPVKLSLFEAQHEARVMQMCIGKENFCLQLLWSIYLEQKNLFCLVVELCAIPIYEAVHGLDSALARTDGVLQTTQLHELIMYLIAPIIQALEFLHDKNMAHLDVKDANILVTRKGVPKLTDFGSTRQLGDDGFLDLKKMKNLGIGGTPYYVPYEIVVLEKISAKADIYSLCVTIFNLLGYRNEVAVIMRVPDWNELLDVYVDEWKKSPEDKMREAIQFRRLALFSVRKARAGDEHLDEYCGIHPTPAELVAKPTVLDRFLQETFYFTFEQRKTAKQLVKMQESLLKMWHSIDARDEHFLSHAAIVQKHISLLCE